MSQIYKCTGKLKSPAELKTTAQGTSVCRFDIAISAKGNQDPKKVLWWRVNAWDALAEDAALAFKSAGQSVSIEGYFKPNYMPDGNKRNELTLTAIGKSKEPTAAEKYAAEHGVAVCDEPEPDSFMADEEIPF